MRLYLQAGERMIDELQSVETEEGGHYYTWKGKRVPGVSEILELNDVVLKNAFYEERREAAAARGKDVHLACWDLDRNYPDWWTEDPELAGYVKAYKQFKKDFDFKPTAIEVAMFHPDFHYAGQPDRFGELRIRTGRRNVTLDLKAVATIGPHVPIQLAGYNLFTDDYQERDMIALQLKPTGKYSVHQFDDVLHQTQIFLACLTLARWKDRHHKLGLFA